VLVEFTGIKNSILHFLILSICSFRANIKLMKYVKIIVGFLILIGLQLLSNSIIHALKIHFPAPLLGMVFLAFLLHFKILPLNWIENTCKFLLKNMILFFVPLLVGITLYAHIIGENILPIILTVIISSLASLIISAKIVDVLLEKWGRKE